MSVMIASTETTAKIANLIYRVVACGYEQERFNFTRSSVDFIRSIWGTAGSDREQRIYEALRRLNYNSYNACYKKSDAGEAVDYHYKPYSFNKSEEFYKGDNGAEDFQKLKSIQFFRYQCIEHNDNPELNKMYNVLQEIEIQLICNIILSTPEWKAAKWE